MELRVHTCLPRIIKTTQSILWGAGNRILIPGSGPKRNPNKRKNNTTSSTVQEKDTRGNFSIIGDDDDAEDDGISMNSKDRKTREDRIAYEKVEYEERVLNI